MPNNQKFKTPMPEQDAAARSRNFEEIALGYSPEQAKNEAARCLNCKGAPCVTGCPVNVNIPAFIKKIADGDTDAAYEIITRNNALPAVCGRVCPQESQCERFCVRNKAGEAVAIGRLERFAADNASREKSGDKSKTDAVSTAPKHRAAMIGSGPASLTCAAELLKAGWAVTIFEALHVVGGVLTFGIPEFRLPKRIVAEEIKKLADMGAVIETDVIVGQTVKIERLQSEFDAVFIGSGAGLPMMPNIKGENACGVYTAGEFLTRVVLMKAYEPTSETPMAPMKRVAVIGGGNVAMDAARSALRLVSSIEGAEVHIVYRRGIDELPARLEEIHHAREEGVIFDMLCAAVEIKTDDSGNANALHCRKNELGEPDASGRRSPVEVPNSDFDIPCDTVILAIGTTPNPLIGRSTRGLAITKRGCVAVAEGSTRTNLDRVYAGGDATTGAATVILAMGAGKKAAAEIIADKEKANVSTPT